MAKGPSASARNARESVNAIGRAFAKDIEWTALETGTKSYVDVIRNLRRLERHYLAQTKAHPKLALEIRRRIAENELEQALLHGCAQSVCRKKLKAVSLLGFKSVERKAHFYLLYARGALARGHKLMAKYAASAIEADLERSLKRRKSPLGKQCLQLTKEILNFINNSAASA